MMVLFVLGWMLFIAFMPVFADAQPIDWDEVALRYGILETLPAPLEAQDWQMGDQRKFWVINSDTATTIPLNGEVVWLGENFVVWFDTAMNRSLNEAAVKAFSSFDTVVMAQMREVFGSECSPGIDGDTRVHALVTDRLGSQLLGYFSSRDSVHPAIQEHSNGMELFLLSGVLLIQDEARILNTLTHEFQHMIHFAQDANEESTIDEGFSGFAEELTGIRLSNAYEREFLLNTDTSMAYWPVTGSALANYGASYLFTKYAVDRLGLTFLKVWGASPENGFDGLDEALISIGAGFDADALYLDWLGALIAFATENEWEKGYTSEVKRPISKPEDMIRTVDCISAVFSDSVQQYGTNFYRLDCPAGQAATVRVRFNPTVPIVDAALNDSQRHGTKDDALFWWSGTASNSVASLQREFMIPENAASVALTFQLRYDLERSFDYLYLLASIDDGATWQELPLPDGTAVNDSGFNLGRGVTGTDMAWQSVTVDLDAFRGETVLLRFDVITDQAVTGHGVMLRGLSIEAIGFSDEFAIGDNGWQADGFRATVLDVPQPYGVVVAAEPLSSAGGLTVRTEVYDPGGETVIRCDGVMLNGCVFGITALQRDARVAARYEMEVEVWE